MTNFIKRFLINNDNEFTEWKVSEGVMYKSKCSDCDKELGFVVVIDEYGSFELCKKCGEKRQFQPSVEDKK